MNFATILQGPALYLLTNHDNKTQEKLFDDVELALSGGVKILQYRDKSDDQEKRLREASGLKKLTQRYRAMLIINDDINLARNVEADGVHLGQDDGDIATARQKLGEQAIIGVSCYNDLARARQAAKANASYLAFGRFFPSRTKPNAKPADTMLIAEARQFTDLPIVAIGGITPENAQPLVKAGVNMIAVIDAVFGQADIAQAIEQFNRTLTR